MSRILNTTEEFIIAHYHKGKIKKDVHYRSKVWGHADNFVSSMKTHFYLSNELKIE